MKKSARTTISVPVDLKARMDAVEGVNWSSLACRAFEAKLVEITKSKGVKDMQDVVARLRASKARTTDEAKQRGLDAGSEWAKTHAEAVELERLEAWTQGDFGSWTWRDHLGPARPDEAFGPEHHLADAIRGGADDFDRRDGELFWEEAIGTDTIDAEDRHSFLTGFVEGALAVWEQVKDQL